PFAGRGTVLCVAKEKYPKERRPDGLPRCAGFPALLALLRARLTHSSLGSSATPPSRSNNSNKRLASSQNGCGARLRRRGAGKSNSKPTVVGLGHIEKSLAQFPTSNKIAVL